MGAVVFASLFVWTWISTRSFERRRTAWKDVALSRLQQISIPNPELDQKVKYLKTASKPGEPQQWVDVDCTVMINGEYLVHAFHHGFNVGWVDHLFLARGSNGRWYYSTYHFCNDMVGVLGDDQPQSIHEFVSRYSLQEFDGKSDVCLKHTWP
jgi:hypothetical protein